MSIKHMLFACSALTLMSSGAAFAQDAAASGETGGLREIVVTAQRKSENLQDVPVAVTAFDSEAIATNRIQNVSDLGALAPNAVVFRQPGGGNIPQLSIRGVNAGNSASETDNPITMYIDGVYMGRTVGAIFDLADIERIEVLKGPQGTLFGRNSTGGAVSITTSDPSGVLGAKIDGTVGNFSQRRVRATLDLPEWNGLSLRLSYLHGERDGDIRNLGAGTKWDFTERSGGVWGVRTSPETLGAENVDAFRAALKYEAGDFSATYKFDLSDSNSTAPGTGLLTLDATGIIESQGTASELAALGLVTSQTRPDAVNNAFDTATEQRTMGHVLTMNVKATDNLTFKNILSYRTNKIKYSNQIDAAGGLLQNATTDYLANLLGGLGFGGMDTDPNSTANQGDPLVLLGIVVGTNNQQFTEEAQLNYESDKFSSIVGAFYFDENVDLNKLGTPLALFAQGLSTDADGVITVPGAPDNSSVVKNKSYAVYGQGTYHVTDQLDLTVGGRQTWDDRFSYNLSPVPYRVKQDKFTYLFGANYKPSEDVLTYIKYSTGYVSGGVLGGVPYEPELARSLEGGVKADLLGNTLRVNAAVFHTKFSGVQFITFANGIQIQKNAGKAKSTGAEIEITAAPVRGLTINAAMGYSDFKYTELDPAIGTLDTFMPSYRSKVTANGSIDYDVVELANGAVVTAHADVQYRSKFDVAPLRTALSVAPQRALVGARLSLRDFDLGFTKASVALWGKNLTNSKALSYGTDLGVLVSGLWEQARTYGMDLSIKF